MARYKNDAEQKSAGQISRSEDFLFFQDIDLFTNCRGFGMIFFHPKVAKSFTEKALHQMDLFLR